MTLSRRKFLQGLGMVGWYMTMPEAGLLAAQSAEFAPRNARSKILVVIQLGGGNDGLNTVVPYTDSTYYGLRRQLAIKPEKILPVNQTLGLNPALEQLHALFGEQKVAIVQGVGYPKPNRSHFRSIEIWQTGQPDVIGETGWLGRYLDLCSDCTNSSNLFPAVNVEPTLPKTLAAKNTMVPSVSNVFDFKFRTDPDYVADRQTQLRTFDEIYESFNSSRPNAELLRKTGIDANSASDYLHKVVRRYQSAVKYPNGTFANGLKFIAQMIAGGVNSRVFTVNLDGFDTHTNQLGQQNRLLKQFSDGVSAFYRDLESHNLQNDVLILAFSEFGRRVAENSGRGTDHGTAAPVYVIGNKVNGGVYGDNPRLTQLDDGDLKYGIDFRSVYATLLDRWLQADSKSILGGQFDYIPFV